MRLRRPRLEGKTAVIIGIASGQGRVAALAFAEDGAVVLVGSATRFAPVEQISAPGHPPP
ncbi:hypothetical protein ACPFL9_02955 [Paenarthrobacter sp. NyZ202]|uniref:hypothetical protein n=1 Tax=Paenarthrobacter sp. NyZ202 TaxID=3402689 RepID=UPI003CFAAEC0